MPHTKKTINKSAIVLIFSLLAILSASCNKQSAQIVWTAEEGNILKNGKSEYFIGTNLWYAGRLAKSEDGLERLDRELDTLKSLGVTNLRVLATEGEDIAALRCALDHMHKRGMCAVLFLNNAWEWSYGFSDYLEAAGAGSQPKPATDGYSAYMNAMAAFSANEKAVSLNHDYVRTIVSELKDHPAIFSWQISNEPRCFSNDSAVREAFVKYIHGTAALIKSLDPVHMVSTGNEGLMGCEEDNSLYEKINDCEDIDYITIHIWPYNWSWVKEDSITDGISGAVERTGAYIDEHLDLARRLGKALVIEEFGYPRDGFRFERECPTDGRDRIYSYVFSRIVESAENGGELAGCNFWGWGGFAQPAHEMWQEGDDLCGDPAQEAQGLNSVFVSDSSTVAIICEYAHTLSEMTRLRYEFSSGCLFTDNDGRELTVAAYNPSREKVEVSLALISDLSLMEDKKDTVLFLTKSFHRQSGNLSFPLDGVEPGFYQVNLSWRSGERSGSYGAFNIGIDPEKISSPQDKQPDFDEFWDATLSELAAVPMEIVKEYSAEHSNAVRNSYRVEITSLNGEKMGGYLCEPVGEGKYPVFIDYMGYGADPYWYDPSANPEAVEFLVSVRQQGIFKADNERWIDRGLDSKENFYYRGAFCDVVRAVDFAASLEKADTAHIYARGESQGGAFALISASLDPRIDAIAPAVPFLGDYKHYSQIVWWPVWEVFNEADAQGISREELFKTLSYFDVKNFTDRISCPVYMAFGLQDPTCPPHTNFAGYNIINAPKQYLCIPSCGHAMWKEAEWSTKRNEWFALLILAGCSASPKEELLGALRTASEEGVPFFGHQDDLMYGHTWNVTKEGDHSMERSDVLSTAGAYPYVLGLDLGGIEIDSPCNLDGNDFNLMREAAVKHYERGGIVTLSWHLRNPLTGGDSWDVSSDKVVESILPGGEKHEFFMGWLDRAASYIASLKDSDGNQIPVIFRPWHEHTGGWFWWGTGLCSAEQYNSLWAMTYDFIVNEKGMDYLCWAISPGATDKNFEAWEERYPGDEYVDIVGLDGYCSSSLPQEEAFPKFIGNIRYCLGCLDEFAKKHGKILTLTETGYEGLAYEKWWTEILQPAIEGSRIAYLLVWRNTDERPYGLKHFYAPWPGGPSEQNFKEYVESGKIKLL